MEGEYLVLLIDDVEDVWGNISKRFTYRTMVDQMFIKNLLDVNLFAVLYRIFSKQLNSTCNYQNIT